MWIKRLFIGLLAVCAICIVSGWLFLAAPFFSETRRGLVQDYLSRQIGQPLVIETDVRAVVALTSHFRVSGVVIPSETIDGLNLAELNLFEFDLDLISIIRGQGPGLDNIKIDGLSVNLITRGDGAKSWDQTTPPPSPSDTPEATPVDEENGIIAFLSDKTTDVRSVKLSVENETTGFEFLFALETAQIVQNEGETAVTLFSRGAVNDQKLEVNGFFLRGGAFTTSASMGEINLAFDGERLSEASGGGFGGTLAIDTGEIGDFLEVMRLNRAFEGSARLTADLVRQGTILAVKDLGVVADFLDGPKVTVEGSSEDILAAADFDLTISGQFFPDGSLPARATKLSQLKLISADTTLFSDSGKIEVRDTVLKTNLFEAGLEEIGPISVGRVFRTEAGTLAMEDIEAEAGPTGSPYVVATGHIEDLLELRDLEFSGRLNAPANLLIPNFENDVAQAFGGVAAEFELSDQSGQLSLTELSARSENTNLWTMQASASARSVTSVDDVDFEIDLDVPDGGAFLEALDLTRLDIGPVGFFASAIGLNKSVETRVSVSVAESSIETKLDTVIDKDGKPTVRGRIYSKQLNMKDLDKTGEAIVQLMSLDERTADKGSSKGGSGQGKNGRKVQPLVLERDEDATEPDQSKRVEDGRIVQPLVLDQPMAKGMDKNSGQSSDGRTVQPLVLEDRTSDGSPGDLVNPEKIGRDLDLEIDIDIEKIVGQAGVSEIASKITSKNGKAELVPVEFRYAGGFFRVGAAVDFIEAPRWARIYGATSGWDFGEILEEVGAGIEAYGKLRADFDLTGQHSSARKFVDSMSGAVNVSMVNGKIATSLLELAGLGLFPWLFSNELQRGYSDIVCVVAPLRINPGKATSNAIVVETKRVQLVASGSIDWGKDRISLRAAPRPVGRPLARTAWPFEVSGKLSNPDFSLGGRSAQKLRLFAPRTGQVSAPRTPCKPDSLQAQ